jgi:hypothetical protein
MLLRAAWCFQQAATAKRDPTNKRLHHTHLHAAGSVDEHHVLAPSLSLLDGLTGNLQTTSMWCTL